MPHSEAFDVIPYEDIKGDWKKLGAGSFGNVYKGNYLGIDVAIKEVLPSNDYDVAKYFEREWRLMKECRHPNVVLYLGLSRAPDPDGRIFIISEFIDGGNLRSYIHDKHRPLPWRLRISFATDIARALAYLHARRCIHRDLKGENLLVTANGRLKVTDFGFARIAARNADESRRLTFCGTDSYMSPEILQGEEFDLPTDIFSLGVIFCELGARTLADDHHFKRAAPSFTLDAAEVRKRMSPGCPDAFVSLCLDCTRFEPGERPNTREILARLAQIETEVLARPSEADAHVGSVKFITGGKRPGAAPRIPSFGMGIGKDIRSNEEKPVMGFSSDEESSDEDLVEAISNLKHVDVHTNGRSESQQPLISTNSDYSTSVVRETHSGGAPPLSSILTIRPSPTGESSPPQTNGGGGHVRREASDAGTIDTIDSFATANSEIAPSTAAATEGGSTIRMSPSALMHRFTLIKPGATKRASLSGGVSPTTAAQQAQASAAAAADGWSPFDFFFSSGMLAAKCDICTKRIGWKPVLECDDCGLRAHLKCGETAPRDCGLRPTRGRAVSPNGSPAKGHNQRKGSK